MALENIADACSPTGERNSNWNGGRILDVRGYVRINVGREHPMSDFKGYVKEHRLIMAEHLGRMLDPRKSSTTSTASRTTTGSRT